MQLLNWFRRLIGRRDEERRLTAELTHHLEELVNLHKLAGLSDSEARRRAQLEFGALEAVKDDCRDARGTMFIDSSIQDIKYSIRTLRKSPIFALTAIATLALGIGANTAVFKILDAVFLRDLPVRNPNELVTVHIKGGNGTLRVGVSNGEYQLSHPLFDSIGEHQQGLSSIAAWQTDNLRTGIKPNTRELRVILASGQFFRMLDLAPAAGRLINSADDQPGCAAPGVVLSYDLWQSQYGGLPNVIGQRLAVLDHPLEIIGVAPPRFTGLEVASGFDFVAPLCAQTYLHPDDPQAARRDVFDLSVMGRLKSGWTTEQAGAQLLSISPELFAATAPSGYTNETVERYKTRTLELAPGGRGVSMLRNQYRASLYALLGLTGLILLIACANLANLMLARASSRRREFAVRMALGGSRLRLLRQALTEAFLLTAAGAAAGWLLAGALSQALIAALARTDFTVSLDMQTDSRMLAFTSAIAIACCLLFGLAPALIAFRNNPADSMKSSGRGLTEARHRFSLQRVLIVVQISTSLVLVVGALLLVGTFRKLATLNPGFRTHGILIADFDLGSPNMPAEQSKRTTAALLTEIRAIPRVESAAATTNVVISGGSWTLGLATPVKGWSKFTWVSPDYFKTIGTPLIGGRGVLGSDVANGPSVAVVNETFVRRYFPGGSPIGKTFRTAAEPGYPETEFQIVGICKDTRYFDLRTDPPPQSYGAIAQHPSYRPWAALYVRASGPMNSLMSEIKTRVNRSHPGFEMEFRAMDDQVRDALVRERLLATLSGFFGVLAILLATIGLYGVVAYIVLWRRKEVGIRIALGSTRWSIVGLFMKDAATLIAAGVVIGSAAAFVFARSTSSILFGMKPDDAAPYLIAAVILAGVAALGSFLPAHRAARLEPLKVLRDE